MTGFPPPHKLARKAAALGIHATAQAHALHGVVVIAQHPNGGTYTLRTHEDLADMCRDIGLKVPSKPKAPKQAKPQRPAPPSPPNDPVQQEAALATANELRIAGADVRRSLADGVVTFSEAIRDPRAGVIPLRRFLYAVPGMRKNTISAVIRSHRIGWEVDRVRDLTPAQIDRLAGDPRLTPTQNDEEMAA